MELEKLLANDEVTASCQTNWSRSQVCYDGDDNEKVKKSNRLNRQSNTSARAARLFCTFLCRHCTTTTGKCLISRFMEDANKRRELECGP